MAKPILVFVFAFSFIGLVLNPGAFASQELQFENECRLDRLNALEPDYRFESEGGVTESWNPSHKQFECAGVAIVKRTIQPKGLLLPQYTSVPQLVYIVRGRGLTSPLFSGCPETFEDHEGSSQEGGKGERRYKDQHQKIRRFREGDVIAFPAGVAHWCYNEGNEPVVAIYLLHLNNQQNQLDSYFPRHFYIAGNPQEEFQQQEGRQQGQQGSSSKNNVFRGMDTQIIAEAFNIDEQLASKLQSEKDNRGNIVIVEQGLSTVRPPSRMEEQGRQDGGRQNGVEETYCSMRIKENIGKPSSADVYSPDSGFISRVNRFSLPILAYLGLSAERGYLYNGAIQMPHWVQNAHSIIYAINGEAQVQVVDQNGNRIFDGTLRQDQVLTVPQNYVVVKQAQSDRFEWVAFKTHESPLFATLGGRISAVRSMPVEVVANAYQVSVDEARRIKFGAQETLLRNPRSRSGQKYDA